MGVCRVLPEEQTVAGAAGGVCGAEVSRHAPWGSCNPERSSGTSPAGLPVPAPCAGCVWSHLAMVWERVQACGQMQRPALQWQQSRWQGAGVHKQRAGLGPESAAGEE